MVALAAMLLLATPVAAGGPSDLLPDLRMAKLYDLDLETRPNGRDQRTAGRPRAPGGRGLLVSDPETLV